MVGAHSTKTRPSPHFVCLTKRLKEKLKAVKSSLTSFAPSREAAEMDQGGSECYPDTERQPGRDYTRFSYIKACNPLAIKIMPEDAITRGGHRQLIEPRSTLIHFILCTQVLSGTNQKRFASLTTLIIKWVSSLKKYAGKDQQIRGVITNYNNLFRFIKIH